MTMTEKNAAQAGAPAAEELMGRLVTGLLAAMDLLLVHLGGRLGLYHALDETGPATSADLARRLGLDERYVREWLQAHAVSGLLTMTGDDPASAAFELPEGARDVLIDELSPHYGLPLADGLAAVGCALPELVEAFHTGRGIPPAAYGADFMAVQAAGSRAMYARDLAARWAPAIPGLSERLGDTASPARVADVGCGGGWAAIELAKAYPHVTVEGYDIEHAAVDAARRNAHTEGVAHRVGFEVRDVSKEGLPPGGYDIVTLFNCLHELARPVDTLRHIQAALAPDGFVIIQEDNAHDSLIAPGDAAQRFIAGSSALICLPQSRVEPGSAAIGAMMGPAAVHRCAQQAGYADVNDLVIGDLRFYRLATS